jgi:hypothetical protein
VSGELQATRFQAMAGERRMLSDSIIAATAAVMDKVPPGKKGVLIAGVDIRQGKPVAVVMIGQRINKTWSTTFVYTGSAADGHSISATVTGSW